MRFERRYTQAGKSPFAGMAFRAADSEIRNPDGSIVFQAKNVEVPADWSQVAADVLAQKYFRRAGVPARMSRIAEADVPEWLWRSAAGGGGGARTCVGAGPRARAEPAPGVVACARAARPRAREGGG
ncbi:MAG: hypothetical protein IBJ17_13215, partial [Reyranella sp.]|nr:hypothetical protein [Reyranella sp.]